MVRLNLIKINNDFKQVLKDLRKGFVDTNQLIHALNRTFSV